MDINLYDSLLLGFREKLLLELQVFYDKNTVLQEILSIRRILPKNMPCKQLHLAGRAVGPCGNVPQSTGTGSCLKLERRQNMKIERVLHKQSHTFTLTETELEQAYRIMEKRYLEEDFVNTMANALHEPDSRFHSGHLDDSRSF